MAEGVNCSKSPKQDLVIQQADTIWQFGMYTQSTIVTSGSTGKVSMITDKASQHIMAFLGQLLTCVSSLVVKVY